MLSRKPLPEDTSINPGIDLQIQVQGLSQETAHHADTNAWLDYNSWDGPGPLSTQNSASTWAMAGTSQPENGQVPSILRPGAPSNYSNLAEEENVWDEPGTPPNGPTQLPPTSSRDPARIPSVLRPGASRKETEAEEGASAGGQVNRIPTILRPGAGSARPETNPFKRKQVGDGGQQGRQAQGQGSDSPASSLAPDASLPTASFSQLSLDEPSNNPWQPALNEKKDGLVAPSPPAKLTPQDTGRSVWDLDEPSRQPSPRPDSNSPALLSLPSDGDSAAWDDEEPKTIAPPAQQLPSTDPEVLEESHAWDDLGSAAKGKAPMEIPAIPNVGSAGSGEDWNLIDLEGGARGPPSRQSTWENFGEPEETQAEPAPAEAVPEKELPALPPRKSQDAPPAQPPRRVSKSETYQIRNINWHDSTAAHNPRTSPILVQNANGPCPLMALVNALTLTTPADLTNTALVETLRSREQVSLGLLLDAVLDELIRRTDPDMALPDMTELYDFLKGLHTGMNVNPRFVPTPEIIAAFKRTSLSHVHPMERGDLIPGTFEATKEMALYATFSIPLFHGWLPPKDEPAYSSFERQAASYEDAQNLLFREEELEEKLSGASLIGLSEEEQQVYQDILTIKSFLSISATQLTPWGLEVITKALAPGSVSILFRNDHFSTLYRHPETLQLFGLVTDAGYAGHDEIVWESLVDVNGELAEFFSGDFRLVGGANVPLQSRGSDRARRGEDFGWHAGGSEGEDSARAGAGFTTVHGHLAPPQTGVTGEHVDAIASPNSEQEDRDLALALQLQEEEDERHRAEQERRDRERRLSEQYIEQQGRAQPTDSRGQSTTARGAAAPVSPTTSRSSVSSAVPARRSSAGINIPVTTSTGTTARGPGSGTGRAAAARSPTAAAASGGRGGGAPAVRSLLPPQNQAANRGADNGVDDAPPSYEQASKQVAYEPPEGHPSHPASTSGRQGSTSSQQQQASSSSASAPPTANIRPRPPPSGYMMPAGAARMRPGFPPTVMTPTAGNGRDKDCVVM